MRNYSETYAAAITTFAPLIVVLLSVFNIVIPADEAIVLISTGVSFVGFIWQIVHRFNKGDVSILGVLRD